MDNEVSMLDQTQGPRKKIAIVGAGIAGMSAAYYLSARHDITLYEAAPRLGGHARTVMAGRNGNQPGGSGQRTPFLFVAGFSSSVVQ